METGTTTATNRASINVRYDSISPTSAEAHTAWVQAEKAGVCKTKKRTVFATSWSLEFSDTVDGDNPRRFPDWSGTHTDECEFNWDGQNGASQTSAKMEATLSFSPSGIKWTARGVSFKYSTQTGCKFSFRLHRRRIWTIVGQLGTEADRRIRKNEAGWVYDGVSDSLDTQYPTDAKPNKAFRIDWPSFDADAFTQEGFRIDLREIAEWHNGSDWEQISVSSQGEWYANLTSVLPDGAEGGTNTHGPGSAENVPNTKPDAHAGDDKPVASGANVELDGSNSSDADKDTWTYEWTQTDGPNVTLYGSTSEKPTFTAPTGPETLKFDLKVKDITAVLHHHNPDNGESTADSVTINVNAP